MSGVSGSATLKLLRAILRTRHRAPHIGREPSVGLDRGRGRCQLDLLGQPLEWLGTQNPRGPREGPGRRQVGGPG